jgi:DNA (cytosine-5)-methyltransferase 1
MMRIGSLFAGIGGLELGLQAGLELEGVPCRVVWQVEQDDYCRAVLARHYPHALRFEDVRQVNQDNLPPVDIICGGFPCQDISEAGKGAGLDGDRSGLFFDMLRIVRELQPRLWVMENVPAITYRGLDDVLRSMAEARYDARWGCLRASALGAPHRRERWFCVGWLAESQCIGSQLRSERGKSRCKAGKAAQEIQEQQRVRQVVERRSQQMANTNQDRLQGQQQTGATQGTALRSTGTQQPRQTEPGLGGTAHGVSPWLDITAPRWPAPPGPAYAWEPPRTRTKQPGDKKRLQALGNAVVPAQAAVIGRWIAQELLQPMPLS